jgi:hypothetical protein
MDKPRMRRLRHFYGNHNAFVGVFNDGPARGHRHIISAIFSSPSCHF